MLNKLLSSNLKQNCFFYSWNHNELRNVVSIVWTLPEQPHHLKADHPHKINIIILLPW